MISFAWAAVRVNDLPASFSSAARQVEQPGRLDLGREVGDLGLDRLELGDRLAEGLALLGVGDRLVERALGEADAHRRDADPAAVEDVEEVLEAVAAAAEQVALRHAAVLEAERPCVGGVPAHLAVGLSGLVAGRPVGHDQVGDLLAPVGLAGDGGDRDAAGDVGPRVGDELLGAVDDPLAVLELGGGPHVAGIRAGLRLGQPEGGELLARCRARAATPPSARPIPQR